MRTLLFSFFAGAALAIVPLQAVLADDDTTSGQAAAGQGQRGGQLREMFEQLDLSDAQKAQIKQIRASVPAGKERRQQIMAVLNPDQKAKLIAFFKEHRGAAQGGTGAPAATGNEAPASGASTNANTDTDLPPP